jgi:hypothetical protein
MTRRSSVRAQAQEIYRERVAEAGASNAAPPTPDPSPPLPRVKPGVAGGGEKDLTARVRALYEDTAVPVREIAAVAGVTERTIYKYVIRQNWKRRYRVTPRNEAAAAANRGRRWQHASGLAPAKGAGGRFIRREDKAKPFAQGLKATDPAGRARALAQCAAADELACEAQAEAEAAPRRQERLRAMDAVTRALRRLAAYRDACGKGNKTQAGPASAEARYGRILTLLAEAAMKRWESLL